MRYASEESGSVRLGETDVNYVLCRSPRRKRTITLSVRDTQDGDVRIMAPVRTSHGAAIKILSRRAAWVLQRLDRIRRQPAAKDGNEFAHGAAIPYLGVPHTLAITHEQDTPPGCRREGDRLIVNFHSTTLLPETLRRETRLEILLWFKRQAVATVKNRIAYWTERFNVRHRRLVISNTRRQWGSCSADNTIRINWRILMAPPPLIDYLVAHELCHIPHKNHSQRFWRHLASVMPDHEERRKALRMLEPDLLRRGWRERS